MRPQRNSGTLGGRADCMFSRVAIVGLTVVALACNHGRQGPALAHRPVSTEPSAQPHAFSERPSPVDGNEAPQPIPGVTSGEALAVALSWFEAARLRDADGLIRKMAIPTAIRGFTLTTGAEADACGAPRDTNGIGLRGIECEARDTAELAEAVYRDARQTTRHAFARFVLDSASLRWSLKWSDRNGRWHAYDLRAPSRHLAELVAEVERDPTHIFLG